MATGCERAVIALSKLISIIGLAVTFACATEAGSPRSQGPPVVTGSSGEQLCAKHHQPLQGVTVFGPGGGVCVLVQPSKAWTRQIVRSPNALPFELHRKANLLYSRPVQVTYCFRCEEEVQRAIRNKY